MLPRVSKGRGIPSSSSSRHLKPVFPHYLRRITKWQQMDIEYTFWQMFHLCISPKEVYQHTKYHKQTKNQWARDDPAFVVICSLLLAVSTLAYCAAHDHSAAHAVSVVISVWLVHFLITGVLVATCFWFLRTIIYSRIPPTLMWLNNGLNVIHYFLSPLLVAHGFVPALLSNLLFMVAISYYHYLNFVGYDVLPFLKNTVFFLFPIGIFIILCPISILCGLNPSRYVMNTYFSHHS